MKTILFLIALTMIPFTTYGAETQFPDCSVFFTTPIQDARSEGFSFHLLSLLIGNGNKNDPRSFLEINFIDLRKDKLPLKVSMLDLEKKPQQKVDRVQMDSICEAMFGKTKLCAAKALEIKSGTWELNQDGTVDSLSCRLTIS